MNQINLLENIKQKGKIIYWNRNYGFIETEEGKSSIFFHKSNLVKGYSPSSVRLFDKVTFLIVYKETGKHKGRKEAINLTRIEKGAYTGYTRYVGELTEWNGRNGLLESPNLDSTVTLFQTRITETNILNVSVGDLFLFEPVRSSRGGEELFAFFAYPLPYEKDILFLREKHKESQLPQVHEHLIKILKASSDKSIESQFLIELEELDVKTDLNKLTSLVERYQKQGYFPTWQILSSNGISNTLLIQLWEKRIITKADIEVLKVYFINSTADKKRSLVQNLDDDDKNRVLFFYRDILDRNGRFNNLNTDLKTFLDIVYRMEKKQNGKVDTLIYKNVEKLLHKRLQPKELIELSLKEYIKELEKPFFIEHFDIDDHSLLNLLQKSDSKIFEKILGEYLKNIEENPSNKKIAQLVTFLRIYQTKTQEQYQEIINILKTKLSKEHQFILWLFDVEFDFDAVNYFNQNINQINHYFRLRFAMKQYGKEYEKTQIDITNDGLISFALNYEWNDAIPLIAHDKDGSEYGFLKDITDYEEEKVDVRFIAQQLFKEFPKYVVHHLRLWLCDYVENDTYDYVGFKKPFKELSKQEQKVFKNKAKEIKYLKFEEQEKNIVKPCDNFISLENGHKKYTAEIQNIFFFKHHFALKLEDGSFTEKKLLSGAHRGWNRIPSDHEFNQFITPLIVENKIGNKIVIGENVLDELANYIDSKAIEDALTNPITNPTGKNTSNIPYVEDYGLKKNVVEYLEEAQIAEVKPTIVGEPRNYFRRLDETSDPDDIETVCLYTLETNIGYAIIWENLDFSDDRATYIFKTTLENHDRQLDKIKKYIMSYAQLRYVLISKKDDKVLPIFKNNLGYVASIRKKRGDTSAFNNWKINFKKYIQREIPPLPDDTDLNKLQGWKIDSSKRSTPKSKPSSTRTVGVDILPPSGSQPKQSPKKAVFSALKKLNELLATEL